MWIKDYMVTGFTPIGPEATLADAVKIMVEKKINSMIVVDEENRPIGLVSSQILIKEVVPAYLKDDPVFSQFGAEGTFDVYAQKAKDRKIKDFMYRDFHIINENDAMIEVASYMVEGERRTSPVVNDTGKVVGIITRTCIKNALYNAIFKDNPIDPKNGGCC